MAAISRLHFSAKSNQGSLPSPRMINLSRDPKTVVSFPRNGSVCSLHTNFSSSNLAVSCVRGGGGGNIGNHGGGSGSGGGGGGYGGSGGEAEEEASPWGPIGLFIHGWRSRVAADPQFPFKVLMEEIVGLSACVLGDMASRPNFGLYELDHIIFVSTGLSFVPRFVERLRCFDRRRFLLLEYGGVPA